MGVRDDVDAGERRELGFWWGTVMDNIDPERRGRIKALVPGLITPESDWAEAVGLPGAGEAFQGLFFVPPLGATVLIGFIQGDIDEPFYLAGPWSLVAGGTTAPIIGFPRADGGVPSDASDPEASETDRVMILRLGRFDISIDARGSGEGIVLTDRTSKSTITIDATFAGITIKGTAHVTILSDGAIGLDAPAIHLNGRKVLATTRPI